MLYPQNDFALVGLEAALILTFIHPNGMHSVIVIINVPVLELLGNLFDRPILPSYNKGKKLS
jgi:hypothetical protein